MRQSIIFILVFIFWVCTSTFAQKQAETAPVVLDSAALSSDLQDIKKLERYITLAKRNTADSKANTMKIVHRAFTFAIRNELREYDQRKNLVPNEQKTKFDERLNRLQSAFKAFDNFQYTLENHAEWAKKTEIMEGILADMQADLEMWKQHLGIKKVDVPSKATARRKPDDLAKPMQHR